MCHLGVKGYMGHTAQSQEDRALGQLEPVILVLIKLHPPALSGWDCGQSTWEHPPLHSALHAIWPKKSHWRVSCPA